MLNLIIQGGDGRPHKGDGPPQTTLQTSRDGAILAHRPSGVNRHASSMDRTRPHSLEAERAVLGAVLRDNEAYEKAQAILGPLDFYNEGHRVIFAAMGGLAERGEPIDLITLGESLRQGDRLDAVGGATFLSQLIDATPTAGHVRHYAKIVKDRADRRSLRRAALEVLDLMDGEGGHDSDSELLARSKDLMSRAVQGALEKSEAQPLVRLIRASEFEAPPVEWLIDGLVPAGMVTLFSGKDTLGKTLFALEVARSVLTGKPLLGNWTANATGPVVALFLDDARPVTHERLETLGIKAHPSLWVASYDDIDLSDPVAMLAVLEAEALQRKAKLIVVDSLWHLIPPRSGAANDQGLMRLLMQSLGRLAGHTGAAVCLWPMIESRATMLQVVTSYGRPARPSFGSPCQKAFKQTPMSCRIPPTGF